MTNGQGNTGESVTMDEFVTITTERGIPFMVVYGKRQYRDGSYSDNAVVSFYDRRYNHTKYGQFVSDYNLETMLQRSNGWGLNLYGGT